MADYHFNEVASKKIEEIIPKNLQNLSVNQFNNLGPKLQAQLPEIKKRLLEAGHTKNVEIVEMAEKTFLFEGYQEHFEGLVPLNDSEESVFPIVLAHNDNHEQNVLMSLEDNRKLMLIDFEETGWNPMAMDLAHYIIETMKEMGYPYGNGINWYLDNFMEDSEIECFLKAYLTKYFEVYMV